MFPALRVPFIRLIYSYLATITWCISLWNRADMLRDHLADSRSSAVVPSNVTYDFIVVGAGSSGAVVANRLSDRFHSVLLLDAGGEPFPISQIPSLSLTLLNSHEIDWMHKTVSQPSACHSLKNSESLWSQGKGLGGTSNMNAFLVHSRGSRQDFDNWAKITGDPSWSYNGVLPYFKKSEDFHGIYSETGKGGNGRHIRPSASGYHGKGGPIRVEISPERRTGDLFVNAAQELGYLKADLNGNYTEGFDNVYYNIKNGRREGAFNSYLKPIRTGRTLKILKFAHVNKVLLRGDDNVAYGVEYIRDGQKRTAFASKEVILSAGAIQSPKLLMLSGIGPKQHLELHNIKVMVDSPAVGKNLQDHISVYLGPFFVDPGKSFLLDRDLRGRDFIDYYLRGTGILGTTGLQAMGFISTLNSQSSVNNKENHIRKWPNIQLLFSPVATYTNYAQDFSRTFNVQQDLSQKYYEHSKGKDSFTIITSLARPEQRGDILLESNNPYAPLRIDPRYLQNENDVQTLVDGIKMAVNLVETAPSFNDIGANFTTERFPGCEHQEFRSDAYWECFARQLSITLYNFVGTCAMGPANNSSTSVVDPELQVVGAKNLRVIDAAVMPVIPLGGTNAACVMIGEKGADMILKRWKPARTGRNRGETLTSKTLTNNASDSSKPAEDDSHNRNNNDDNIVKYEDVLKHTSSNPLNVMEQWLNTTLIMQTPSDSKTLPTTKLTSADVDMRAAVYDYNGTNLAEPKVPTTNADADMENETIIYSPTRNQFQPVPVQSLVNHRNDGNAQVSGIITVNDGHKAVPNLAVARQGQDEANNMNPPAVVIESILSTSKPVVLSQVTPKNSNGDQFSVNVIAGTLSSRSESEPTTTSDEAFQMSPSPRGKNINFIADTATSKKWNVTGLIKEELEPESVTAASPTVMSGMTTNHFETTETVLTNQFSKSTTTTTTSSKPNTLATAATDSPSNFTTTTNSPLTSSTTTIAATEQVSSIIKPQSLSSTTTTVSEPISSKTAPEPISSTTVSRPISSTVASETISSTTVSPPISSTTDSAPISSKTAPEPISSTTVSAPISSTTDSAPISSTTVSEPISSTAASEPISSTTASEPISSTAASEPISSTAASEPISSTSASEPISSTAASAPISSTAASEPISSTTIPTEYQPVSSTPKVNSPPNSTTETTIPQELLGSPNLGKENNQNLKSRQNASRSFSLFSDGFNNLDTKVNVSNPEIVLPNNYSAYSQNANILPQTEHTERVKGNKVSFFNLSKEYIPTPDPDPGLSTNQWNDMVTEVTTVSMITSNGHNPVDVDASVPNIPSEKTENPSKNEEGENTGKTAIKEIKIVNSTSVSGGNLNTVLNWMTILPLITATAIQLHAQNNWVFF